MYADYIKEIHGDECVETEEGFATYRFIDDSGVPSVYIIDIYVRPDFRKSMAASHMADQIVELAKKRGCRRLLGTVNMSIKDPTSSAKFLFRYGMQLYVSSPNSIIFKKELV